MNIRDDVAFERAVEAAAHAQLKLWGYHKTLTTEEYRANHSAAMASPALREALMAAMPYLQRAALLKAADAASESNMAWLRVDANQWLRVRAEQ